ncbi:MAG: rRNA maturation RNase YbeY [Acidobacteriota bacterium]
MLRSSILVRSTPPPMKPAEARRVISLLARRFLVRRQTVTAVFGDDAMLRDLNRRYRRSNRPTDVLSFASGEPSHLGDIVISTDAARRQARSVHRSVEEEARMLLIHGFLHLLGYDHEVDDGEMELLERTLRWELCRGEGRAH